MLAWVMHDNGLRVGQVKIWRSGGCVPLRAEVGQLQVGAGLRGADQGVLPGRGALMHVRKGNHVPHNLLHSMGAGFARRCLTASAAQAASSLLLRASVTAKYGHVARWPLPVQHTAAVMITRCTLQAQQCWPYTACS